MYNIKCLIYFLALFALSAQSDLKLELIEHNNYGSVKSVDVNFEYNFFRFSPYEIRFDTMFYKVAYKLNIKKNTDPWKTITSKVSTFKRIKGVFLANVIDKFSVNLEAGNYKFELIVEDQFSNFSLVSEKAKKIKKTEETEFITSDIIFSHHITKSKKKNNFVLNNHFIVPNVYQGYNIKDKIALAWYFEMYNLNPKLPLELSIEAYKEGRLYKVIKKKVLAKHPVDMIESGIYNLAAKQFSTSDYSIIVQVKNGINEKKYSKDIFFDREKNDSKLSHLNTVFKEMPLDLFRIEFDVIKQICSPVFKGLASFATNYTQKKLFLLKYWTETTNKDEVLTKHSNFLKLINYVTYNEKFRSDYEMPKGELLNDISLVLFRFGFPKKIEKTELDELEIDRVMTNDNFAAQGTVDNSSLAIDFNGISSKIPYEVWHIDINGKVEKFIFAKTEKHIFGPPKLLHSTYENYQNNPQWKKLLVKNYRQF